MTRPQAAARLSAEISRILGGIYGLLEWAEFNRIQPYECEIHDLKVAATTLSLMVAKWEGADPLAKLVASFDKEAEAKHRRERHCPCDGKPNMDPRCERMGMCMVEDGDGD